MRFLLFTFKLLFKLFIALAAVAGLAYAYDNYGRTYNKYVVFEEDTVQR